MLAECRRAIALAWLVAGLAAPAEAQSLLERIFAAQDARATTAAGLEPLLAGIRSSDPRLVLHGVRALGRLERPALVRHILPLATHLRPDVRAEAVNALGQSLARVPRALDDRSMLPPEMQTVRRALLTRMRADADPWVSGVAAQTLGRLPHRSVQSVVEDERLLAALLPAPAGVDPVRTGAALPTRALQPALVRGAVKGLESLIRTYQRAAPPSAETLARLRGAATLGAESPGVDLAVVRRLAWAALNAAAAADMPLIARGLEDADPQVRRLAAGAAEFARSARSHPALLDRALADRSYIVRYEAVSALARVEQGRDCARLLRAVDDSSLHVSLAAIDALGEGCGDAGGRLGAFADGLPDAERAASWHRAAHALVALARSWPEAARERLFRFTASPVWQVRMYGARAAELLRALDLLERLAHDSHDNVREAAIQALYRLQGHEADDAIIEALGRSDYQLLLTAAGLLEKSPHADRAVPALLAAFARLTSEGKETSRDIRLAILDRLRELGTARHAADLGRCAADYDPEVAASCARTLQSWTGSAPEVAPARRAIEPVRVVAVRAMRVTMRRGGAIDIRLFPDEAPATVARVVRLARQGYYNGLTFHRVVPNFVLQGGSPGANEYAGDGPFMRDEVGLRSHTRGTLGISTRGRDTGDAQLFINLVDNPRLDHHYTVFAEVTSGMEVVDDIREGDVIDRVDVLEQAAVRHRP